MEIDKIRLFNPKLIEPIVSMTDDEMWQFIVANEERVKEIVNSEAHAISGFLWGYRYGMERIRELFLKDIEYYREGVDFTMIMDFCFKGEPVQLDYWARCGYLDDADSCDAVTSNDIIPEIDEDSDEAFYKEYFHLLELQQVENIIRSMEENFDKLTINTREDIDKIKAMKQFCLENEDYKVAYIYDL